MVSLSNLLHRTPMKIHRNSQSCNGRITSSTMNADDNGSYYFVRGTSMDRFTSRKAYKIVAKIYTTRDGKMPNNPKVFIWCACAWFKFNCEVALAIRGSSYIANSNGALPKITNPTARPQVCKHCLAFLRTVRSRPMVIKTKTSRATSSQETADDALSDAMSSRSRRPSNQLQVRRTVDPRSRNEPTDRSL
jgi:hypothetical protein